MTEQVEHETYIKCSACKCKYINDDEHIKIDFGYNRLNVQYKTCVKCRASRRADNDKYRETEKGQQIRADYYERKGRTYNCEKLTCSTCGKIVCRNAMVRHERENNCPVNK